MKYTPEQIEHQIKLLEVKLYKEGLTIVEAREYNKLTGGIDKAEKKRMEGVFNRFNKHVEELLKGEE